MGRAEFYTKNQLDKLGNALIYLCVHLKPYTQVSKTHLLKLIFIVEEFSVKKLGIPMFGLRFDVWKLGPVSKDLFVELSDEPALLTEFIEKKQVAIDRFEIVPKMEFSDDEFSDMEMSLMEEVIDRFKYCTSKELIDFTHRSDSPWYLTAQRNGLLEAFNSGKLNTTDVEIDLSDTIKDDEQKLTLYRTHKEYLEQSRTLKA